MLRLALEWRQALADIDSMIVTPVTLSLPTPAATAQPEAASPGEQSLPEGSGGYVAVPVAPAQLAPTAAPAQAGEPSPTLNEETLNILLLGTDARAEDTGPTRTDAIVLVRIARDSGRVSMLSIPRDLWVSYPTGGEGRINAAYAVGERQFGPGYGAAVAKATVGQLLGLEVDNFVLVNFEGFRTIIDELGGIVVDVPQALYDPAYPTDDYQTIEVRFRSGTQLMDSERALMYARTRHADSDFGRNQRQQLVLMAIFERVRDRGLLQQLTSLDDYTRAMRGYVQTDLSRSKMLALATLARDISPEGILRYAIDNSTIVDLRDPATFAAEPRALRRIVSQFTGEAISTAGGE